jgi:C4-dicarboxylate-specific signal transduction histidine kinase
LRHLHVVGHPSLDASGVLKNYVGTTVDLSEYRRAQEVLEATQANLAHASRLTMIGELTSLIAHEVHQPLTAIATRAGACRSWLSHDPPDVGKADLAAGQIAEYAHHAANVIESIRQLTRKSKPMRTSLNINDAIRETAALLGGEIRRQCVLLKADLATGLPDVLGDRIQLQQVIMNLMVNGIEAMATVDGRPRSLALSSKLESSGAVVISVADVGVGLPNGITESLFERFFTTKPNGMGIGLTICRSIVEAHGGTLSALANHPYGSIFRFSLPLA